MNPVVLVHMLAALLAIGAAIPLIRGQVKMNPWYGVRLPAAFTSGEQWLELNRHGGRLLLCWGLVLAATAFVGAFLVRKYWITYDWTACVIVLVGLALVIALLHRHARKTGEN